MGIYSKVEPARSGWYWVKWLGIKTPEPCELIKCDGTTSWSQNKGHDDLCDPAEFGPHIHQPKEEKV